MVFGFYQRYCGYYNSLLEKPFSETQKLELILRSKICLLLQSGHKKKGSNLMIVCFKDPIYVLMKVLLCKIQCPSFTCFCKPSQNIYAANPLRLENTPQVSTPVDDDNDNDHDDDVHVEEVVNHEEDCVVEEEKEEIEGHTNGEILKSSLKKSVLDSEDGGRREKKKVQWVDLMGKELAEIREFESSEEEDIRYDGDQTCVCVIL